MIDHPQVTTKQTEYLKFSRSASPSGRTVIVTVYSAMHGDKLGLIKWFGRWRQYAFFPEPGSIWNTDCMATVSEYIQALMTERKKLGPPVLNGRPLT